MATSSQSSVFSFLLGASLGAATGLLLAPYPGRVTRQKLAEQARLLPDQLGEQFRGEQGNKLMNVAWSALQKEIDKHSTPLSLLFKGVDLVRKMI